MSKIKVIFLGYLWRIPLALCELNSIEVIGIGLENKRKNTAIATLKLNHLKNLFFDAEKINENEFAKSLFKKCDYVIIGAFGQILKKDILEIPRIGVCNFHTSFLPELRGGSPIENLIMQDKRDGGITFHWVDEGIDSGSIITRQKVKIDPTDHYADVYQKYHLEFEKMARNIEKYFITDSNVFQKLTINDEPTYCDKFSVRDYNVSISDNIETIFKKIKAFGYFDKVILSVNNKKYSCRRASIKRNLDFDDGISISSEKILVFKGSDNLEITDFTEC